ncbi:hypothetical protein [Lysobacter capsici]|uniref:hypothetical protein n=1 Tax=Lysobacter capsici TaxID=435897 RepID=UPI001C001857|nr:hypothetical protein [Lysobacter capsici]QWF19251.1 hypothetical protein KME82_11185 [Lysobacter capsici]
MKAITLALAGLLGLAALQPAHAEFVIPAGPFANEQALVAWWNANNSSGLVTEVFLNGRKVYDKPTGWGPAMVAPYYLCAATQDVRARCNSTLDGSTRLDTLIDLFDTGVGTRPALADTDIYLGADLVRPFTTPSRRAQVFLIRCLGDSSRRGGFYYYKFHHIIPDFGPPISHGCY